MLISNVAGAGDVAAVKIKVPRTGWLPMGRNQGQNYHINSDLKNQHCRSRLRAAMVSHLHHTMLPPRIKILGSRLKVSSLIHRLFGLLIILMDGEFVTV
ncbi:expansin-a13 [Phtheirospermum japonicum]|uniref:Expansin-a13 n=1 Tax=Phtheirospermum japonicum TaxID=374723 RepID=A0A830CNS0_9LAMI|nr:expansin-a13 [Phtheirospermum japonicum]